MTSILKEPVFFCDLGQIGYKDAWDYQEQLLRENVRRKSVARSLEPGAGSHEPVAGSLPAGQTGRLQDDINKQTVEKKSAMDIANRQLPTANAETQHYLLFVEHPPVFTLGKSGSIDNLLVNETELNSKGIEFFKTNRGGDITFHGPEQVVGYPVLDLEKFGTDLGKYLRNLEEVIIRVLADYGLKGERSPGETGVWLDAAVPGKERKICALGIRCSRWITMHGFAFNVNTDLTYFDYIIPCGIQNKQVTSLMKELGRKIDMEEVKEKVKMHFELVFGAELVNGE